MSRLYRLLLILCLITFTANAYSPIGELYVLEYPVDMPDVSVISETNQRQFIRNTDADLTIMVFWSQNCAPCLREMKYLEKFYPKAAKDNVNIMLIAPSSEWNDNSKERQFLTKYGAPTIPFYNDKNNKLSLSLGIGSTPYTVIMDRFGKKVATIQGETDWSSKKLYKKIKKLIK